MYCTMYRQALTVVLYITLIVFIPLQTSLKLSGFAPAQHPTTEIPSVAYYLIEVATGPGRMRAGQNNILIR